MKPPLVVRLSHVYFKFDKFDPRLRSIPGVDKLAEFLTQYTALKIVVEGHTDSIGSKKYNDRLSKRRAEMVRRYLIKRGIDASRIDTVGYGKSRPIASNKTLAGRRANRRVEIRFIGDVPTELEIKIRRLKF